MLLIRLVGIRGNGSEQKVVRGGRSVEGNEGRVASKGPI